MKKKADNLIKLLDWCIKEKVFPGAVLCVSKKGRTYYDLAIGFSTLYPEPIPLMANALFDVASITKPMATTSAIMYLVNSGDLDIDQPVCEVIEPFRLKSFSEITFRDLLNHCSGLPAYYPFYKDLLDLENSGKSIPKGSQRIDWAIEKIIELGLEYNRREKAIYSDLGFIVLGRAVELISGQDLDSFCREKIFQPLGMFDTFFLPLTDKELREQRIKGKQIAYTEQCPWRGKLLRGEVHDDNCYSFGGIAGHAGLFSTASDIHKYAITLLQCYRGENSFFPPSLVREFWRRQDLVKGSTWALGWDTPSEKNSQAGELFSREESVGHLGFTGCSLWIDRKSEIIAILLTNRVHPHRTNDRIKKIRPIIHNVIFTIVNPQINFPDKKLVSSNSIKEVGGKNNTFINKSFPILPVPSYDKIKGKKSEQIESFIDRHEIFKDIKSIEPITVDEEAEEVIQMKYKEELRGLILKKD